MEKKTAAAATPGTPGPASVPDPAASSSPRQSLLAEMEASGLHPEELMDDITQSAMGKTMAISLVVHALVIGLTSIAFLGLAWKYKSLHPRAIIKQEQREAAEKKAQEDAAKAEAEALQRATEMKAQIAAAAAAKAAAKPGADGAAPAAAEGAAAGADRPPSKIEQAINETSDERPDKPTVSLDNVDEL